MAGLRQAMPQPMRHPPMPAGQKMEKLRAFWSGAPSRSPAPTSTALAAAGRGGDTEVGHLSPGEVVVPHEVQAQPGVRRGLRRAFQAAGTPMGRYEVGGMDDSINPTTGMREFFGRMGGREGTGHGAGTAAGAGVGGGDRGARGDGQVGSDAAHDTGMAGGGPAANPMAGATVAGRAASAERDAARGALSGAGRDPRNVADQMAANLAMSGDAGWFSAERRALPTSRRDRLNSMAAKVLGSIFGVGGWAYTDQARAWNAGRMAIGAPHHDPETGTWTSEGLIEGLDPRNWHPGPRREDMVAGRGRDPLDRSPLTEEEEEEEAGPQVVGGVYTPEFDPERYRGLRRGA